MSPLPLQRQRLLACLIMVAVAFMVSSMDIYLPAMPLMRDHFGPDFPAERFHGACLERFFGLLGTDLKFQ